MLDPEKVATIRRLYFAEHWKIGTIASELGVHRDTVRAAVETDPLHRPCRLRPSRLDPYLPFLRETLERHPRLRATRLLDMIRQRGYVGSIQRLRCVVARLRPATGEPFLRLVSLPGEQAQVDWAHFGEVVVGRAKRRLSCFVMTLFFSGVARVILYDNLKSAVLERQGSAVHFHPRLIELCSHYHFQPRPCAPGKGNQKGKVERAIRYVTAAATTATSTSTRPATRRPCSSTSAEPEDRRLPAASPPSCPKPRLSCRRPSPRARTPDLLPSSSCACSTTTGRRPCGPP